MENITEKYCELVRYGNPYLSEDEIDVLVRGYEHPTIKRKLYKITYVPGEGIRIIRKNIELDDLREKWRQEKEKYLSTYPEKKKEITRKSVEKVKEKSKLEGRKPTEYNLFYSEHCKEYLHLSKSERPRAVAKAWKEYKEKLANEARM